jgi:Lipocalin-like domain
MLVPSIPQNPAPVVGADLIGSWSLESYTDIAEGAEAVLPFGVNPIGLLIYTPDGFMSAQLMSLDRSPSRPNDSNAETESDYQQKSDAFIGYSGEYHFDDVTATVSHTPSVSFVPALIGHRLLRQVKLDGDRLTLTVTTPQIGGNSIKSSLCWLKLHC